MCRRRSATRRSSAAIPPPGQRRLPRLVERDTERAEVLRERRVRGRPHLRQPGADRPAPLEPLQDRGGRAAGDRRAQAQPGQVAARAPRRRTAGPGIRTSPGTRRDRPARAGSGSCRRRAVPRASSTRAASSRPCSRVARSPDRSAADARPQILGAASVRRRRASPGPRAVATPASSRQADGVAAGRRARPRPPRVGERPPESAAAGRQRRRPTLHQLATRSPPSRSRAAGSCRCLGSGAPRGPGIAVGRAISALHRSASTRSAAPC